MPFQNDIFFQGVRVPFIFIKITDLLSSIKKSLKVMAVLLVWYKSNPKRVEL